MYPESDPRLIYKKYKNEKNFEMEDKIYASYFVNISTLLKTSKPAKILLDDQYNSIEQLKPKDLNTLTFSSMFESGNLFSAFKVYQYDLINYSDFTIRFQMKNMT